MPPVRLLLERSSEASEARRETLAGMAPARGLPLRLRLASAGNAEKSKASSVPATPAPGTVSAAIRPAALHATPDQEPHGELAGDHDESGEEAFASEIVRVDFHVRSALASAASPEGETAPHVHASSRSKRRRALVLVALDSMASAAV
uniref:Uncharacterized protein n=1 Tax=Triticum urartu TaxID=4572 RepID=A0A8R7JY77_TRIUA